MTTIPPVDEATGTTGPERSPGDDAMFESLARQARVLDAMAATAAGSSGDAGLGWLALQRQAERYLRNLDARARGRALARWGERLAEHRRVLHDHRAEARQRLSDVPGGTDTAQRRHGLRVALIGKGGAGKSMISGTLARVLARRGHRVLAADLDTNPGLAFSLGVPTSSGALPDEAIETDPGAAYGWRLASGTSPAQAVERFATPGPDGVRFLALGKIDDPDKTAPKRSLVALLEVLLGFGDPSWDVIGDLEAGPTTPFERYHAFADQVLMVVGPAWRSAMTARRLLPLVADVPTIVVANRFRHEPDHPGLAPAVRIPFDADVADAERRGVAPIDACPDSPAVQAVNHLADLLVAPGEADVRRFPGARSEVTP
ncbi:MAG: hypothetical protein KY450_09320 [Actinobacteria bacterium]|nr:hypothetical protein [Actinomycetota bacterium]